MARVAYTTDGEYSIYQLADEDRYNYTELHRQTNGDTTLFLNDAVKDLMWDSAVNHQKNKSFPIYDFNGEYCGNIEIQNYQSNTPEMGIDLLENKRNQGIAVKTVKMLTKQFCKEHNVDYFLIRIMENNPHSIHVFEKMGAMPIGTEENIVDSIIDEINYETDENYADKIQEIIKNAFKDDDGVKVLRYKLLSTIND